MSSEARSDCTRRPSSGLCSLTDLEAVLGCRISYLIFPTVSSFSRKSQKVYGFQSIVRGYQRTEYRL
jgi:hypothetical protein